MHFKFKLVNFSFNLNIHLKLNHTSNTSAELPYWLALSDAPDIGPMTFIKLLAYFPSLAKLFALPITEMQTYGFTEALQQYLQNPDWKRVEKDLRWQEQPENYILTYNDTDYPRLLRETHAAPPIIYVKGQLKTLNYPQLAIIGSRHPTVKGSETAYDFAYDLASKGLTITSGLALGIDSASHQGALAGGGTTIAVLGSGLNKIYPLRHKKLAEQIIEKGAIISEFSPDMPPLAAHFPRRNRIISGLSRGALVIEAAIQSGSLITAKYALEQGREVFAVPGSIHNPLAKGCHALLKQGAKLVETSDDIIEELKASCPFLISDVPTNSKPPLDLSPLDAHYRKLVACVDFEATPMDVIIHRSGLAAEEVSAMVLMLELQGFIRAVNGGCIRC